MPPQSRFHCTFIVRRTHCGRENRAKVFSLKPANNSLTSAPSIGQAVKPPVTGCLEWRRVRSRLKISSLLRCAAMSWLDRLLNGMVRRLFQPAARYKRFADLSLVNAYCRRKLESARFVVSHRVVANGVVVRCGRAIASVSIA
jgi:hypothetical protein